MSRFKTTAETLLFVGAIISLATPAAAARVEASANAGHHLLFDNGGVSNQTVYTDQHSIYNVLPSASGAVGALVHRDNGVVTVNGPGSSATRLEVGAAEPESVARAYGDLRTGKVGAYAGTSPLGFASASAVIADNLTFNIAGADAATITPLRFLVSLHAATPTAHGAFIFRAGTGTFLTLGDLNRPYYGQATGWSQSRTWLEGSTRFAELVYNIQGASAVVGVELTLEAIADLGSVSDFYHTGGLQLQAPGGVTFTSDSGVFLTAAVPEPATWAMLIGGFGMIGAISRRKRATQIAA